MAEHLADNVQADYLSVDDGTMGCEANHQHVQKQLAAFGVDWIVIVEDDAQPVPDFRIQAVAALAQAPAQIVSFYLGTGCPTQWQPRIALALDSDHRACWLTSSALLHAVAYAIRTDLQPTLLDGYAADYAITRWARANDHQIAYTLPSLVDHADLEPVITQRSDRKPRDTPRRAWRTGTRDQWNTTTAPLL